MIASFGMTDTGRVRENNEDFFLVDEAKALYILADGIGGGPAGEIASQGACRVFAKYFKPGSLGARDGMADAFAVTNRLIYEQSQANEELRGMGTTLVACHVEGATAHIVHAGDVRAYHASGGALHRITEDHSVVAELVKGGYLTSEQAAVHPMRNQISRAVGIQKEEQVDYHEVELEPGDLILLCSDGLWGSVPDETILRVLAGDGGIEEKVRALVRIANEAGGKDNITALALAMARGEAR